MNNENNSQIPKKKDGRLKRALKAKAFKKGSASVVITCLFIACVVIVNIIASTLYDRFPWLSTDLTAEQQFVLDSSVSDYVQYLDKEVTITVLADEYELEDRGPYYIQVNELIKKMAAISSKITVKYVNLTMNPSITSIYKDANWESSVRNLIVIECGEKYRVLNLDALFVSETNDSGDQIIVSSRAELAVSSSILTVTSEDQEHIAFLSGYGGETVYADLASFLSYNNFKISNISLLTDEIPEDVTTLILCSPTVDISETDIEKLNKFLSNDGLYEKNLIFMPYYNKKDTENIEKFLSEWGMSIESGYAYETDPNKTIGNFYYDMLVDITDTDFSDGLSKSELPFRNYGPIAINITDTAKAAPILQLSADSSGIRPFDADESWTPDEGFTGSVVVGAKSYKQSDDNRSNVVVLGSCLAFSKAYLSDGKLSNSEFIINMLNTLSGHENSSFIVKDKTFARPSLGNVTTVVVTIGIIVGIIPLAILAAGFIIWIRRRNK